MQMPVHDSARQLTPCGGWIMGGGAVRNIGLLRLDSRRARATRDSREIVRLEPS
jgi:hypothetical protein